jgi:hypothetical protein
MTVAHNKYSDWTDEEYQKLLGYKKTNKVEQLHQLKQ